MLGANYGTVNESLSNVTELLIAAKYKRYWAMIEHVYTKKIRLPKRANGSPRRNFLLSIKQQTNILLTCFHSKKWYISV